jgi:hypothetical protein
MTTEPIRIGTLPRGQFLSHIPKADTEVKRVKCFSFLLPSNAAANRGVKVISAKSRMLMAVHVARKAIRKD